MNDARLSILVAATNSNTLEHSGMSDPTRDEDYIVRRRALTPAPVQRGGSRGKNSGGEG